MSRLTLYSTDGCHLCERAQALLADISATEPLDWQVVDIAGSDDLIERYGIRIPVLLLDTADYDLGWPFTAEDVRHYLHQAQASTPS